MPPSHLADVDCWQVTGVKDAAAFFRAVPELLPDATRMYLEGSPAPGILALLAPHVEQEEYGAPAGTLWSWPRRSRRFAIRMSSRLLAGLSEAAAHHAEPEICAHLHFYREAEPLAQWFDAFDDPLLVAKRIPRERVEQFCLATGGELAGGHGTSGDS